jgi:hypothetical protein
VLSSTSSEGGEDNGLKGEDDDSGEDEDYDDFDGLKSGGGVGPRESQRL